MNAVLERTESRIEAARREVDQAHGDLAALDARIALYQEELDQREIAQVAHRTATITAVGAGKPPPKAPKVKPSDAEVALPILRGQRVKAVERVTECEGLLRRACVEEVERRYGEAQGAFAEHARALIASWRDLVSLRALLDHAGVKGDPLPPSMYSDFSIPALGRSLRPLCENHSLHFLASHTLAGQGELLRMAHAVRLKIESDLGEKLPW